MARRRHFLSTLLIFMSCNLFITDALQCVPLQPTNITCEKLKKGPPERRAYCKGTRLDNAFWASSRQPIARAWPHEHNSDIDFFQKTYAEFPRLVKEKRIRKNLRSKCIPQYRVLQDGSTDRYEYNVQQRWVHASIKHQKRIGLKRAKSNCFTQLNLNTTYSKIIMRRMRRLNHAFEVTGMKLLNSARTKSEEVATNFDRQIGCWKNVTSPMAAFATTNALQCTVMHSVGFRRYENGKFNIGLSLTNAPVDVPMSEKHRHYLSETVTYDEKNRTIRALPIPSYFRGDVNDLRNDTTTALFTWGGSVKISYFMNIPTAKVSAVRRINEATSMLQDNIHDGIAASNIAILLFPAFLAMIPISSLELPSLNNSFWKVVAYAAITDIVAVLPLLIKGVELLIQARRQHTQCTAWTVSVEDNGLAIIELWCAECVHHDFFQRYGIALIISAFVFMIFGVASEMVVFGIMRRRRREAKNQLRQKWWDRAGITGDICTEYDCCGIDCDGTTTSYSNSTASGKRDSFSDFIDRYDYFSTRHFIDAQMNSNQKY